MVAAKRKRDLEAAGRPKKRAKGAPSGSKLAAKAGPEGAAAEEYSIPAPVSQVAAWCAGPSWAELGLGVAMGAQPLRGL